MTDQQARAAFEEWWFAYVRDADELIEPDSKRHAETAFLAGRASAPAPEPATDIREVVFRALDSAVEGPARSIDTQAFFDTLREKGLCVAPIAEPATDEDNDDIDEAKLHFPYPAPSGRVGRAA